MEINYKPNSNKFKEEQTALAKTDDKKVEKVISGSVRIKKKSGFRKFLDLFIPEDTDLKSYIVKDVMVPAVKKTVSDTVDTVLYGSSRGRNSKSPLNKISYTSYYDRDRGNSSNINRTATVYSYDNIILESRGEAEQVLSHMCDMLDTYEIVTVADLYDLVGISSNFTDNKYGWTNLRNAEVVRTRDGGYALNLPRALPIK